jgi:hypothetical protein
MQCQCVAPSTNKQCKNIVKKGSNSTFCHLHQNCKNLIGTSTTSTQVKIAPKLPKLSSPTKPKSPKLSPRPLPANLPADLPARLSSDLTALAGLAALPKVSPKKKAKEEEIEAYIQPAYYATYRAKAKYFCKDNKYDVETLLSIANGLGLNPNINKDDPEAHAFLCKMLSDFFNAVPKRELADRLGIRQFIDKWIASPSQDIAKIPNMGAQFEKERTPIIAGLSELYHDELDRKIFLPLIGTPIMGRDPDRYYVTLGELLEGIARKPLPSKYVLDRWAEDWESSEYFDLDKIVQYLNDNKTDPKKFIARIESLVKRIGKNKIYASTTNRDDLIGTLREWSKNPNSNVGAAHVKRNNETGKIEPDGYGGFGRKDILQVTTNGNYGQCSDFIEPYLSVPTPKKECKLSHEDYSDYIKLYLPLIFPKFFERQWNWFADEPWKNLNGLTPQEAVKYLEDNNWDRMGEYR